MKGMTHLVPDVTGVKVISQHTFKAGTKRHVVNMTAAKLLNKRSVLLGMTAAP